MSAGFIHGLISLSITLSDDPDGERARNERDIACRVWIVIHDNRIHRRVETVMEILFLMT